MKAYDRPVFLTTGGTGGHMFPAEATARALRSRGIPVCLVTDKRGNVFGDASITTIRIHARTPAKPGIAQKLQSLFELTLGYFESVFAILKHRPAAIIGFGGYASVPAALAASHLGVPVILHDPNAVLGLANRFLSNVARKIAVCFEDIRKIKDGNRHKLVVTGNPVRAAITEVRNIPYRAPKRDEKIILLVTGGSQGAQFFGEIVPAAVALLPEDIRDRLEVIQQCRQENIEDAHRVYIQAQVQNTLSPFFTNIPELLSKAHLVIARSGASTVSELSIAGRPAILIPYPHAADNHQLPNAHALTDKGAGWLFLQDVLTPEKLSAQLRAAFESPELLQAAAEKMRNLAHENAADRLAELVIDISYKKIEDSII